MLNLKAFGLLIVIYSLNPSTQAAYFNGCDYNYTIQAGYSYLQSPNSPDSYPSGSSCRYKFVAPLDYDITVNCTINLPKGSDGCTTENFYFGRDGDIQLRDSEQFCGVGTFIRKSLFRSVVLAYTSNGSRGNFRCQLYAKPQPCDCGWSMNSRIVNGKEANINEYPSMVALKDKTSNVPFYCSAIIISHRYLLTAAHCVSAQPNPANIEARVGRHNIESSMDTKYADVYNISNIIKHPGYTAQPTNNDIAIMVTTKDIEYSRAVGPICLPPASNANNDFAYDFVDVIGWGSTRFAGATSPTLQKVTLMVTDYQTCKNAFPNEDIFPTQICTSDTTGTMKDSCQHDSGGPVIYRYNRQFLVGIISYGKSCGADKYSTGINTRVTSYLQWIFYNTWYSTCMVNLR